MPDRTLLRCAAIGSAATILSGAIAASASAANITSFTPGDLVISTVSCSVGAAVCNSTPGGLDTAAPIVLQQFQLSANGTTATAAGTLTLPQTASGANAAISGEYGSASEGILQDSANGQYLTIMGYGVNANTFNTAAGSVYGTAALGQTTSLTGTSTTTVPRVVALIGSNAGVDTTTALTGVFNTNNPRSAATVDGSSFYVSGQGVTGDGTGGVFYATKGATTATAINANTTAPKGTPNGTADASLATETRAVEIVNTGSGNTLYVSRDFSPKGGPNDATDIRALTNASGGLPTSAAGLVATRVLPTVNSSGGNTGSIDLKSGTTSTYNGINNARTPPANTFVYLSPEQFFFANATTMYVTDSGEPKNGNANAAALGEGGLQKWSLVGGTWTLDYDLVAGLNLVNNAGANAATPTAAGVTGLFGLAAEVVGGQVELFATSYGLNELSPSYLYEITDTLSYTTITQASGETFTTLEAAPAGTLIRGVAFAPAPEPASLGIFGIAMAALGVARKRRRAAAVA
nr:PEP-CTERM sorting domain-containing protein [uncultured Rhodopila sp.]